MDTGFSSKHLVGETKKIADIVNLVIGESACSGGCKAYYSPEEWEDRGEEYGKKSKLVVVHDGGDLAYYCNSDYGNFDQMGKLEKTLANYGYYIESCTCWYSAIYKI